jgi:MFS transporter, DHA1 family, tetracycline resistance protein
MPRPAPPPAPPPATAARSAPLAVIFFTVLLDLLGFGMVIPLLPFYAERYGASPFDVALLFASFSLAQFVFAPVWGRLSDRVGRRPVLLGSIAGAVAAYALFAFAHSFPVLLAARIASGVAAANYSIAQAWVADVTTRDERARGMGLLGAAFGLGFVLGPVLGGLAGHLGYAAVPAAAGILSALNLALAWALVPESLPPVVRARHREAELLDRGGADRPSEGEAGGRWLSRAGVRWAARNPAVSGLMGLLFLVIFAFAGMEATLGLFVEQRYGWGFAENAWLFTYIGVVMVIVQGGLLGRLARRFGESRLIAAGIATMAVGLVLLPVGRSVALALGATGLLAVGMGLHNPSTLALISRLTPDHRQGGTLGVARSLGALARGVGPLWGGWAFGSLGPGWPFWSGALLMTVALVVAIPVLGRVRLDEGEPGLGRVGGA